MSKTSAIERIVREKKPKSLTDRQLQDFIKELELYEQDLVRLIPRPSSEPNRALEQRVEDLLSLSNQMRRLLPGLEFLDWVSPEGSRLRSPTKLRERLESVLLELESVTKNLPVQTGKRGRPRNFRAELVSNIVNRVFRDAGVKPTQTKNGLYARILEHIFARLGIEADTQYKTESAKKSR